MQSEAEKDKVRERSNVKKGCSLGIVLLAIIVLIIIGAYSASRDKAPKWTPGPPAPTKQLDNDVIFDELTDLLWKYAPDNKSEVSADVWEKIHSQYLDRCVQTIASKYGVTSERIIEIYLREYESRTGIDLSSVD